MINKSDDILLLFVKIWLEIVVGIIMIISISSVFSIMSLGGWLGLCFGIIWISYRIISKGNNKRPIFNWQDWPFYIVIGFTLLSICIRPHSILDSYTYRLPQILLWIQEGHPLSVPNVDFRINQMPHIWHLLSTVFFLPFGERRIAKPNLISYLLLIGILKNFALNLNISKEKSRWIILIFTTTPVVVMQAASNDNVLTSTTFLMISIYFSLLQPLSISSLTYSSLSFALCCGIKPQYIILAPLWLFWFIHENSVTIKQFHLKFLIWIIPIVIICSPLPTFFINYFYNDGILHPKVSLLPTEKKIDIKNIDFDNVNKPEKIWERPLFSYSRLAFALLALPINPLANDMTKWINNKGKEIPFLRFLNWHKQRIYPILIPENASFSFFATLALIIGIFRKKKNFKTLKYLSLGSLISLFIAIWISGPADSGRSFIGYFMLMLPFSFVGLALMKKQILKIWGIVCLSMGLITIIINPSSPLWPVQTIISRLPASWTIDTDIKRYSIYSKRIIAGNSLIAKVPRSEKAIGAILNISGTPSVELWKPYSLNRQVKFYSKHITRQKLKQDGISYLLLKHNDLISEGQINSHFINNISAEVVMKKKFTTLMRNGPEAWFLLKIK